MMTRYISNDCNGKPIIQLPKDSPVRSALEEIVKKLGL